MWEDNVWQVVEAAVGPAEPDPRRRGDCRRVDCGGTSVWVSLLPSTGGMDKRTLMMTLSVSVGARPICLWVHDRQHTRLLSAPPEVHTGDPAFDQQRAVHGFPPQVLREVLDDGTRRWLSSLGRLPKIVTEERHLVLYWPLGGVQSQPPDLQPAILADWVHRLCDLGGRAVSAFDRQARQLGPDRAREWVHQLEAMEVSTAADRSRQRSRFLLMLAAMFGFVILAIVVVTVIFILRL